MDLTQLFGGVYLGRRVLVTGHTGFKGSWLVFWLRQMGAKVAGLSLDPDTEPSHWNLLNLSGIRDARINLLDADAVSREVHDFRPQVVFHLAAQALVKRSYRDPAATFATNITGLVNLLEALRSCGTTQALVNATTDKVYAAPAPLTGYSESHGLGGHDPYSTSKACAELITDSYRRSFFTSPEQSTRVATARAGNVIGGGDWSEDRLVPDLIRAAFGDQPLRLRNPDAVRPWQHVLEPLSGYLLLGQALLGTEDVEGAWNFGPAVEDELSVNALVGRARARWPELQVQLDHARHPHEATRLTLNCDKALKMLGWKPVWDADTAILHTLEWYRAQRSRQHLRSAYDLQKYIGAAHAQRQLWAESS